ncbi:protein ORF123 [Lake sturgeon herpesvirus]|nr:protein ORF123 [Lake sturgeon herpesvirus]
MEFDYYLLNDTTKGPNSDGDINITMTLYLLLVNMMSSPLLNTAYCFLQSLFYVTFEILAFIAIYAFIGEQTKYFVKQQEKKNKDDKKDKQKKTMTV